MGRQVGPKLGPLARVDPKSSESYSHVGLDDFGPICRMCKLPVPSTFWRPALLKMASPQLKQHQSDRLAAKRQPLGTFGAGGFVSNLD